MKILHKTSLIDANVKKNFDTDVSVNVPGIVLIGDIENNVYTVLNNGDIGLCFGNMFHKIKLSDDGLIISINKDIHISKTSDLPYETQHHTTPYHPQMFNPNQQIFNPNQQILNPNQQMFDPTMGRGATPHQTPCMNDNDVNVNPGMRRNVLKKLTSLGDNRWKRVTTPGPLPVYVIQADIKWVNKFLNLPVNDKLEYIKNVE